MQRRTFVKNAMGIMGMGFILPSRLMSFGQEARAEEKRRGGGVGTNTAELSLPMVEPGKGMAASLTYVSKNSEVKDAKIKTERQGVPFDKQKCMGCALYTKVGAKNDQEVGKCAVFPAQLVASEAWCNSWAKKV